MAELNLSQLRSASDIDDVRREEVARLAEKEAELIKLTNENVEYIRRVAELTAYIQQASIDREQIIHQVSSENFYFLKGKFSESSFLYLFHSILHIVNN